MTIIGIANPEGTGNMALLDLPLPLEPIIVDLDRPLEEQLPKGIYLDAARKLLAGNNS